MTVPLEVTPERLEAVERELERLRADRDRREREEAAKRALASPPAPPKPSEFSLEATKRHDAALAERRRVRAEWEGQYEEQLARVAPKVEKLERRIAELEADARDEQARHAEAGANIAGQIAKARRELGDLTAPPAMPWEAPPPERPVPHVAWTPAGRA